MNYIIESIETNGPKKEELNLSETLKKLNLEKSNKRMIFIDGKPVMDDIITESTLSTYKKGIMIVNELIGG